jgi:uncharacterized protein
VHEPDATTFVVARDGTRLATDIYLPRRPGRVPAVVARTPYGKTSNVVWFPAIGRLFADNGMAFVAQDTRGRYASEGELAPFAEASDGWDTFEWITRQPWSDGSIAVFGESYVGFAAIAAAATAHPALRAAAIRNTGTDIEGDWLRHQGVLRLEFVVRWAFAAWSGRDNLAPEFDWTLRPPAQIVQALSPIVGRDRLPAVVDGWATGGRAVAGPQREATFPSLIDRVRVPTHLTTGWWDLFVRGATRDWARLASRPGVDSRLVAEPTDHAGHDWGDGPTPDPLVDFDALAARMPVVLASELDFLRKHLLGVDDGGPSPVSWMLTHAGVQQSPSWPPPDAAPMTLHLVDGGRAVHGPEGGGLSSRPDRVPVDARWRHDPADPVPSLEGEAVDGWFRQPDERLTHVRDDVLTFTSDPYRKPLDLAGPVVAELVVTPPSAGCHVMAKLSDVYPTGESRRIADGAFLVPSGGGEARVIVDLGHTGYRVRAGHRLRLDVAASAFPRYILHPGTPQDAWSGARTSATRISVRTGRDASVLRLTVR